MRFPISRTWSIVLGVVVFAVFFAATAWVGDDIYITLRSVEQLLAGHGPRWNPHERVQAFTHPLWFLLLVPARLVTGDAVFGALGLSFFVSLAALLLLPALGRRSGGPWWMAIALLFSSRAWVDYLSSGLETPLTHLLLTLFLLHWLGREGEPRRGDLFALAGLASLVILNRFDLALLILPMLLTVGWEVLRGGRRALLDGVPPVALGASPLTAWSLFSLAYYGFLLPNTAYAKLATGVPAWELWQQGWRYLLHFMTWDPAGFAVVVAGSVCALALGGRWRAPGLGMLAYSLYVLRVGGDFMAGRFFVPLLIWGAVALSVSFKRKRYRWQVLLVLAVYGSLFPFFPLKTLGPVVDASIQWGIVDERGVYSRHLSLIELMRRAPPVRAAEGAVSEGKSVGRQGYEAGLDQILIDHHGLTDPLLARVGAIRPWRIGHFERTLPAGYRDSLERGENLVRNPRIHSLYEDILRVARGPLWNGERFRAIVRLNLRRDFPRCSDPPCRDLRVLVRSRSRYEPVWDESAGRIFAVQAKGRRVEAVGELDLADDDLDPMVTVVVPSSPVRHRLRPEYPPDSESSEGRFRLVLEFPDAARAREAAESLCLVAESRRRHPHVVGSSRAPCRELLRSP
ncbi:MAG: hypothetical protein KDD47_18670 [Acidobacteria bacterium]|nr:hypothetical protein [Acidobacteriota bacterium]